MRASITRCALEVEACMTDPVRPEDVIVALLAEVKSRVGGRFAADPVHLHPSFFAWREQPEFDSLLNEFIFDTRDYFPFSDTLESVLDSLQFAGYLERTNPRGTWYQITPALEELYKEQTSKKFEPKQLIAISVLANNFISSIKTDQRIAQ